MIKRKSNPFKSVESVSSVFYYSKHLLSSYLLFYPLLFTVLIFSVIPGKRGKLSAQPACIDKIAARIGNEIILLSDIESQRLQLLQLNQGEEVTSCSVLEELILQKLLLHQAALDSIPISDSQVESELDRRLRYFISQFGSEEKLEEYYNKKTIEIKAEFRDLIKDQLLIQQVQQKIIGELKVTPSEVHAFYNEIPEDSIPLINSEVEIAQIVGFPDVSPSEKQRVKERLQELRDRIMKGEDFGTLAYLYSEDKESAKNNGELGFTDRGALVPEFEAVAYNLKPGETSGIVETKFGSHIIQIKERRGNRINARHILLKPKTTEDALTVVKLKLDSIRNEILQNRISFADAAAKYSDDGETAKNGGLIINENTGASHFETSQLDAGLFFTADKLNTGEISVPVSFQTQEGREAYRLLMLKSRTDPHKINLKDDYRKLQEMALSFKQHKALNGWVKKKKSSTFIKIDDAFVNCTFVNELLK